MGRRGAAWRGGAAWWGVVGLVWLVCGEPARAELPRLVLAEGSSVPAALAAVDAQWMCTFALPAERRPLPAKELVRWGRWVEPGRGPYVVLADGGLLVADVLAADKQVVRVDSGLFGELKLPLERVAGILFQPPADRLQRDLLFDAVLAAAGQSDRIVLTNGDELAGTVRAIQEGRIRVETSLGPVEVELRRLRCLIYNPTLRRADRPWGFYGQVGFSDGSQLNAASLQLDAPSLRITVLGGQVWTGAAAELVALQPRGGLAEYLSDLRPAGYQHVPYLEVAWPYHLDRSVLGARLRAGGTTYLRGIGMHSASRLTFALPEPCRRFEAELAVDDETGGQGSVRFRVFVDDRQRYASPVIRGGEPPLPISVDLTGAKRLHLVVDFADRADQADHADWLNARLIR